MNPPPHAAFWSENSYFPTCFGNFLGHWIWRTISFASKKEQSAFCNRSDCKLRNDHSASFNAKRQFIFFPTKIDLFRKFISSASIIQKYVLILIFWNHCDSVLFECRNTLWALGPSVVAKRLEQDGERYTAEFGKSQTGPPFGALPPEPSIDWSHFPLTSRKEELIQQQAA